MLRSSVVSYQSYQLFQRKMWYMGIAGGYLYKIGKLYDDVECVDFQL